MDEVTFGSDQVVPRQTNKATGTRKQRKFVANLLKAHPSLGEPTAWDRQALSIWIGRAKALLDAGNAPSAVPSDTIYSYVPNPAREILGTGSILSELV